MSPTVCLWYGKADEDPALRIAEFLMDTGDARELYFDPNAEEGNIADVVLVLFSRNYKLPGRARAQWEDRFINRPKAEGIRIGFVKCDDWEPPKVLVPQFELKNLRAVKRWVRGRAATWHPPSGVGSPGAALEWLGVAIADHPRTETVVDTALAFEFVRAFREDFDEVFYLDCGERSLPALAGDLAAQLGMRLEGPLEENLSRLRAFCEERRFLLLLDDVREGSNASNVPEHLAFGGRCSTLISTGRGPEPDETELRLIQAAWSRPAGEWAELCSLARRGRTLMCNEGRIAECYELMQQWHAEAEARGDRTVLDESAREMVWILESWGRNEEAHRLDYHRATEYDEQMMLPF